MKVICKSKQELIAKVLLLPTPNLTEKLYIVLLAILQEWKPNIILNDELKNKLCEILDYQGANKWQLLVNDINKLTNIHKEIGTISSPLIMPNFSKKNKQRTLSLHPELEKALSSKFTKLTVEYTYR